MKLKLTVVLTILGMAVGAVVWAYATFTPIPVHKADIENVEEDVVVSRDSILRELDQIQRKLDGVTRNWDDYNDSVEPQ